MSEQDKIILEDLVRQVKNGTLQLADLPLKWREEVQEILNKANEGV